VNNEVGTISVVMPVRDGERYVAAAIESILQQDPPPDEVVVVDDGSTDDTPQILGRFGGAIRVIRQDAHNQAAALNRAIEVANGSLLAFLDSDDLFEPGSLACRVARLAGEDRPDGVFGHVVQFVSPELPERHRYFRFDPKPAAAPLLQTMLVRRSAFDRVGLLDARLTTASNIDWVSRALAEHLRFVAVPDVVTRRRLHGANVGVTRNREKRQDLLTILREHRARRADPPEEPTPPNP
jgi:glycosyltransferase involved in cell wall biosynthesis